MRSSVILKSSPIIIAIMLHIFQNLNNLYISLLLTFDAVFVSIIFPNIEILTKKSYLLIMYFYSVCFLDKINLIPDKIKQ